MEWSTPQAMSRVAVAALLLAVAFALAGSLLWEMTTTAYYGAPGHFTRTEHHQIYPHRAEALWIAAGLIGALCVTATGLALRSRRICSSHPS
jgi:uncharacterized membrane protein YjjB (DUF3815 family)